MHILHSKFIILCNPISGGSRIFFLDWSLRNLNYTKSNKAITWIFATIANQVPNESKIVAIAKPKIV